MGRIIISLLALCSPLALNAQYFLELHSEYDDSFRAWEIIVEQDSLEIEGVLELTWGIGNDFSQWKYSVGDKDGEIKQKFQNNAGLWELRSGDKVVTIRQVWPDDIRDWKISCDGRHFTFKTTHSHRLDDWSIKGKKNGELILYTERHGDPRDWIIEDYMSDDISFEERMAAIFIGIFSSLPK